MHHPPHLSPAASSSRSSTPTLSPTFKSTSKQYNQLTKPIEIVATNSTNILPTNMANPPTSLIATDSSESPVTPMPKLIPLASSSSTSSMSSYASSASSSDSETYVNDLGGDIIRDLTLWSNSVPRAQIQRTYSSSSSSSAASSFSSPRRARHIVKNYQHDHNDWGPTADDVLSLEDLQLHADDVSNALDHINTNLSHLPTGEWEAGEPPPPPSSTTQYQQQQKQIQQSNHISYYHDNINLHDNQNSSIEVVVEFSDGEQKSLQNLVRKDESIFDQIPSHHRKPSFIKEPCERMPSLTQRIDDVISQLAGLQLQTADRAAEADARKGTTDASLRDQVKKLRATLDSLARICLQKAFQVRDEVEAHR